MMIKFSKPLSWKPAGYLLKEDKAINIVETKKMWFSLMEFPMSPAIYPKSNGFV